MKRSLFITIVAILVSLSMGLEEIHFYACSTDYIKNEQQFLCQISQFKLVSLPRNGIEFFDCCLETSGWMDPKSKELKLDNFVSDMKENGFSDRNAIETVVKDCKTEIKGKMNGWEYYRCFVLDKRISSGFKTMLKNEDKQFFNEQRYCKSG